MGYINKIVIIPPNNCYIGGWGEGTRKIEEKNVIEA